jgi:hypothetical protein
MQSAPAELVSGKIEGQFRTMPVIVISYVGTPRVPLRTTPPAVPALQLMLSGMPYTASETAIDFMVAVI